MELFPAVDLMDGRAVRLSQGDAKRRTDYGDPLAAAQVFARDGAKYLHVVDLDGAFSGSGRNGEALTRLCRELPMQVQTGGGIRTLEDIEARLRAGVWRVILGTAAVEDPSLMHRAAAAFPGQIALGLDCRDGKVATRGWVEQTTLTALEVAHAAADAGIDTVIYTDIAKDGLLTGPNLTQTRAMVEQSRLAVIASGGVSTLADLAALAAIPCAGAIIGRALYTGAFTLAEALAAVSA